MTVARGSRGVCRPVLALVAAFSLLLLGPGTGGAAPAKKCVAKRAGRAKVRRTCSRRARHRLRLAPLRAVAVPPPSAPPNAGPETQGPPSGRSISRLAKCELVVRGPCDIYTDKFWEMQAKYADKESGFAEYPVSPECDQVCAAVEYYLYPDGTLGSTVWAVDPCAPAGWRLLYWPYDGPTCIPEPHSP